MDNYEVNVLTRKGGWKKLPQEVIQNKDELKLNNSDNLNINVTEDNFDNKNLENSNSNLFENFTEISNIIDKLKTVEKEKDELIGELNELMKNFEIRKNNLDKKLTNIQKEKEMYEKAINLIISLKKV
tara:strand:- start:135 stop:518 length:384 start_codon:yes stop_codon:yes gene_type:complete